MVPIAARLLDYDDAVVSVQPSGDKLRVTPKAIGGTLLTISVNGEEAKLPISVGVETSVEYDFSDDGAASGRWITNGTSGRARTLTDTAELRIRIFGRNDAPDVKDHTGEAVEAGGTNNTSGGQAASGNVLVPFPSI